MTDPTKDEAIAAAQKLVTAMNAITVEMVEVRKVSKKHQFLIRLLGLSVAFDVLLTIGMGGVGYTAHHTASEVSKAQKTACISSNEARKVQTDLWNYVFNITDDTRSPEQADRIQQFKGYIATAFAQRNCNG